MATRDELYAAIRAADAAGDAAAVQKLGAHLEGMGAPAAAPKPRTSFALGYRRRVDDTFNAIGDKLQAGAEALGFDADRAGWEAWKARKEQAYDELEAKGVTPSFAGKVAGSLGALAPVSLLPGGPLAQGAVGGAAMSPNTDPVGIGKDAAIGAAAGLAGDAAFRAVGGVIGPTVAPAVKKLREAGVKALTPGQVARGSDSFLGRAVAWTEDRLAGLPIADAMIMGGRRKATEQFNRAAVNRALKPIGEAVVDESISGTDAIRYAGDRLRNAYTEVLPKLTGSLDETFVTRVQAIQGRAAKDLPAEQAAQLDQIIQREVGQAFDPSGKFNGRAFQKVSDRLDKLASGFRANRENPYVRDLGEAVGDLREQLHAMARRQTPAAKRLRDIDRGYASLVRVERAALNTPDGIFTPDQYGTAVRLADRSVRKRGVARGEALDQDLANAARQILPSKVPDSGTAGRWTQANIPALMLGAAAAVPYVAGRAITPLLTRTPGPKAGMIGAGFRQLAPIAGFTAPYLLQKP